MEPKSFFQIGTRQIFSLNATYSFPSFQAILNMDNTVVDLETLQSLYDNVSCLKYINDYTLRFFIGKRLMKQSVTEGKNKHVLFLNLQSVDLWRSLGFCWLLVPELVN